MLDPKLKDESSGRRLANLGTYAFLVILLAPYLLPLAVWPNGSDDHSHGEDGSHTAPPTANAAAGVQVTSIVAAERNVLTDAGQFNVILRRSPADPRTGETTQVLVRFAETIEGGFGGGEPVPLSNAAVSATITEADGTGHAEGLAMHAEGEGNYHLEYEFSGSGDYKIIFNVVTEDGRKFSVDFPVSVVRAPMNRTFWVAVSILTMLMAGTIGAVFYAAKRNGNPRKLAPFAVAAALIFLFATVGLAYFVPPSEKRYIAEIPLNAPIASNTLPSQSTLSVSKESQLLFGIQTAAVSTREIASGLKTTGTVRARPDAQAVVVPPVAGRIVLREGITIGSAVGRGEQIGSVEQVLDVAGQTALEGQRLQVEAQQREVEARRLDIKNSVLQLQALQAEQRSAAAQARTRMDQAQRELRRAENLVEVGAAPRRRLEEAQTAVRIVEQEAASAERQVGLIENQIKQTTAGEAIFRNPRSTQPRSVFPLTAPVTGIVSEIMATGGQQVETGTQILSIVNLSSVFLEAQVFERDLPVVRDSTRASFTAAALSGEVYTIGTPDGDGRIVSVGQTVNPETRTFSVIYEVKNPFNRLREGMFVEITVDTSGDRQVLAVPKASVISEQGQTFVFVFNGGESFAKRLVALGAEGADYYEIRSGLEEGERVVVEGIYQLRSALPTT